MWVYCRSVNEKIERRQGDKDKVSVGRKEGGEERRCKEDKKYEYGIINTMTDG